MDLKGDTLSRYSLGVSPTFFKERCGEIAINLPSIPLIPFPAVLTLPLSKLESLVGAYLRSMPRDSPWYLADSSARPYIALT